MDKQKQIGNIIIEYEDGKGSSLPPQVMFTNIRNQSQRLYLINSEEWGDLKHAMNFIQSLFKWEGY